MYWSCLKKQTRVLIRNWSDKAFEGTVVNPFKTNKGPDISSDLKRWIFNSHVKEEEIKLSMIRKAEEDEKNRIRNMEYNAEMQYKDKNGEGT